mmetsp:Transcript_18974/g.39825  ORF Transcript_18974/g.39825 Transcript_18974/m.39825 type:complete len:208 (+) Transcript_18974:180-803(+)
MKVTSMTSLAFAVASAAPIVSCGAFVVPERSTTHHPHRPLLGTKVSKAWPKVDYDVMTMPRNNSNDRTKPVLSSSSFVSLSEDDATRSFVTSRRSAISVLGCMTFAIPRAAQASSTTSTTTTNDDEPLSDAAQKVAAAEAAKERMKQRIAASKKNYRKSTDLVMQRKDVTDYSCVSETGSPCPEGLVPRAVQREIVGALDKLKDNGD